MARRTTWGVSAAALICAWTLVLSGQQPEVQGFYILGEVISPGVYEWSEGMTVRQAIALAGGYTEQGSTRRTEIARNVDGERTNIRVTEDDRVQASDIIAVRARSKAETPKRVGAVDDEAAAIGGITFSLPA